MEEEEDCGGRRRSGGPDRPSAQVAHRLSYTLSRRQSVPCVEFEDKATWCQYWVFTCPQKCLLLSVNLVSKDRNNVEKFQVAVHKCRLLLDRGKVTEVVDLVWWQERSCPVAGKWCSPAPLLTHSTSLTWGKVPLGLRAGTLGSTEH